MSDTPYSYGGYSVTVAEDGAIQVKSGDQVSHYCMAIYHDFNSMATRFGVADGSGKVKSFAQSPDANVNRITTGQVVYDLKTYQGHGGGNTPRQTALDLIAQFEKRSGPTAFKQFDRQKVATELRERVNDPKKIGQDGAGVCGPTALFYNLAQDNPAGYAQLVIDLYENGNARSGHLVIQPTSWFVRYVPSANIPHPADWIPEGSLRNSEDWDNLYPFLGRPGEFFGPSTPWAVARWLKDTGYTQSEWGALDGGWIESRVATMKRLGAMIGQGYRVILLINHDLESKSPAWSSRVYPDHYVGMTAAPVFTPAGDPTDVSDDLMSLSIFSHRLEYDVGTNYRNYMQPVPRSQPLTVEEVMRYVWSYAAGRY